MATSDIEKLANNDENGTLKNATFGKKTPKPQGKGLPTDKGINIPKQEKPEQVKGGSFNKLLAKFRGSKPTS